MKIGLLFGSFNPIHHGHLLLATRLREKAALDEIWFIVSPLNPFKLSADLAPEAHRLEMAKLAVKDAPYFKVSDIEFSLPKPSYTHETLKNLKKQYPGNIYHLLIGEDNLEKFNEWKEVEWIREHYPVLVYNRTLNTSPSANIDGKPGLTMFALPLIDISATEIRERIREGLPVRYFLPDTVEQYIRFHKLYLEK